MLRAQVYGNRSKWQSTMNGTASQIARHYLFNEFNTGNVEDRLETVSRVNVFEDSLDRDPVIFWKSSFDFQGSEIKDCVFIRSSSIQETKMIARQFVATYPAFCLLCFQNNECFHDDQDFSAVLTRSHNVEKILFKNN